MRIVDSQGNELTNVDYDKGTTEPHKLLIAHHDAVEPQEAVYDTVFVSKGEKGDLYEFRLVTPAVYGEEAWDEYEDVLLYTPYTAEQLADIAKKKEEEEKRQEELRKQAEAEAEKQKKNSEFLESAPTRVSTLEQDQMDTDEALTSLYEAMQKSQLDTDEALTSLYETISSNSNSTTDSDSTAN